MCSETAKDMMSMRENDYICLIEEISGYIACLSQT